jgi:hypothetical protein
MFDMNRVDARADVFSLGAVLLSSLARGGLPVLEGVVDRSAIGDSLGRAEGIPPAVGDVVVHALQPRREDRPTALAFYRALVDAMPEALKITPSDVARELAAIRLDREFRSFAEDRSLVGASYVPPRMTEGPSPFATAPPNSTSEAVMAAERMVVPRLPALPLLSSMTPGGASPLKMPVEEIAAPVATPVETPSPLDIPPPVSSASLLPAKRVEYPAAAAPPAADSSASIRAIQTATPAPAPVAPSDTLDARRPRSRTIVTVIAIAIAIAFAAGVVAARVLHG